MINGCQGLVRSCPKFGIHLVKLVELNTNGDRVFSKIPSKDRPLIFDKPGYAYLTLIPLSVRECCLRLNNL